MLKTHGRFPYSGIRHRPVYEWPGGRRLAVYLALNIEHFPYGEPVGVDLDRPTAPWSQRSYLWREYGNRVGGWRLLDLFEELELPIGVIANTANYEHCPDLIAAYRDRGDEMIGHGRSNGERQIEMSEAIELNDQPCIVYRHTSAGEYADMLIETCDEMRRRSERQPLVFAISIHTFIMGQPFRIGHMRRALEHILRLADSVWITQPREIARFYRALPPDKQLIGA